MKYCLLYIVKYKSLLLLLFCLFHIVQYKIYYYYFLQHYFYYFLGVYFIPTMLYEGGGVERPKIRRRHLWTVPTNFYQLASTSLSFNASDNIYSSQFHQNCHDINYPSPTTLHRQLQNQFLTYAAVKWVTDRVGILALQS